MKTLITHISSLVTVNCHAQRAKSGSDMQDICEIKDGAMLFDEHIIWTGTTAKAAELLEDGLIVADKIISADGKTILPGFVDSHTHIVFAGSRSDEFARRLQGASYQEIAAEGGGILRTMKATREASAEELFQRGKKLALSALRHGTTAIEVKSGYSLTLEGELNQLRAIKRLKEELPMHVSSTFLGAHDFPPEYKNSRAEYVEKICRDMIPAVVEENLAEYCDVFTDTGYYTLEETEKIFRAAEDAGLKIRIHADELSDFGAAKLAGQMKAVSADHLLYASDEGIEEMKKGGTIATLLPGTAYTLRLPYAPARKMIDAGLAVALATDCNPGSCFSENMQVMMSLACMNMKMSIEESISAATLNGAAALQQSDKMGSLEVEKDANFIVADVASYADLVYHFGINHVEQVWIKGQKII